MKQGWEIKKLGDIAKFYRGLTYSKDDEVPSSTNMVLRSNNVDLETNALVYYDMKCLREDLLVDEDKKVKANSILICMSNGSKQHIGKVAYIQDDIDYAFGGFMGLIVPTKDIEGKYLYYLCVSHHFKHFLAGIGNGIGITNLRFSDLSSYCFPVPPIAEQEKIVAELDCLSGIIEKKKQQLKELDNLAQSVFYEMFGSVDDNHKNHEIRTLSEVFSIIKDGTHQTPQYIDDKEIGFKFLSAKDVVGGVINWENIKYISEDLHNELYKRVAPQMNDILLCKNGTYGICALVETDAVFDIYVSLALLRPKESYVPKYLVHAINNPSTKSQFDGSIKGIGVPNLHLGEIKKTNIIVPPLTLQQDFASKIESIEKQKELIAQSIKETETLFNSRMDYYFN